MSGTLIIITGLIYAWVAAEQVARGNLPMAVTYASYATANVGLYYMAIKPLAGP
jgi:hypothetical protein